MLETGGQVVQNVQWPRCASAVRCTAIDLAGPGPAFFVGPYSVKFQHNGLVARIVTVQPFWHELRVRLISAGEKVAALACSAQRDSGPVLVHAAGSWFSLSPCWTSIFPFTVQPYSVHAHMYC